MRRSAQRKRISGRKGFTLAELLVVVAIILILAGFGFVAVNRYQKRLKRVEMDNVAREIFVAAQNHLTASRAAGFWDGYVAQMEKDSSNRDFSSKLGKPVGNGSTDKQYVADEENRNAEASSGASAKSSDNVLKILLPYAAVDETLLTDGKYYIHYDAATASVLDVYYTDKDTIPNYDKLNETAKNDVSYRTEHGVGWYGTDAIKDTKPQSELKAPVMAVRNAESLVVYIIDPNYKQFKSGVQLEIAQTGQDGKKTGTVEKNLTLNSTGSGLSMGGDTLSGFVQVQHVTDTDNKPITLADGSTAKDYMLYAVVLDSITRKDGHFSQLFPELRAGADITVTATVSSDQASGEAKSSVTTNSLFEALNNGNALISNARHLENLSGDISALKAQVTTAEITDDLYWNGIRRTKEDRINYAPYTGSAEAFIDAIRRADWKYGYQSLDTENQGSDGSTADVCVYSSDGEHWTDARKFAGIETATLTKLSGNDHVLTGFDIVADFAGTGDEAKAAPSGAGLFASTRSSFEINHLTVKNTRVYAAYSSGSSAAQLSAGTLVGNANGSVTLKNVSAVTDCIKDGEIYQAGTYSLADGKSGLAAGSTSGSGSQGTSVSPVENQISGVYSRDGIAGGLIGTAGGNLKIDNSFASVPVYSDASSSETGSNSRAGNGGIAGGLVGKAAEGTITASFAGGYTDTTSTTSTTSTSNDYTSTTINVAAPKGIAGGLIGAVTGNLNTTETYATTSVSASVGGGFVGVVSGGNLELSKCYSIGRVFAKTEVKNNSGKFAGSIANNGSITPSETLQKADASKKVAEVKNGVLAGTASSNGETSVDWTFPENLIGGKTDSDKSNPDMLQEIPAEDLAAVAGNHDFKAENQTKETGVLTYAYKSSLKGKDYPYPSYTKTSDNSSIQNYAGYDTTGTTKNYKVSSYLHYGDWVVLSEEKSSDVVLGNDAVLYADLKVPEDAAKKGNDGAMTLIVVGESSKNAVCFVIRKEDADKDPVHGTKLKLKRLSFFRQNWYGTSNYEDTTDTTAIIKKADDQSTDISVPSTGDSSGSSGASSDDVTYRIYLDDITTAKGHFGIVCPVLVPGENIKVFAAKGEKKLSEDELKKYIDEEDVPKEARANSLFGNETEYDVAKETGAAQILNGRHLQNLDMETSHAFQKYNNKGENTDIQINFNSAYLDTDIDWGIFKDQVAQCKETADENGKGNNISVYSYDGIAGGQNKFQGILNFDWRKQDQGITDFSGKGKSDNEVHSLLNLDIERKDNSGSALFRDIRTRGMDLHDLNIENISSVSYSGHAAALFAYTQTLDGATVTVKNVKISGQVNIESKGALASAGVILGDTQIPANIENTQIEGTVIVKAGENGNAGGFIGVVNGNGNTTISNSRIHFTTLKSGQGEQSMQSSVIGGQNAGGLIGSSYNQKITVSQTSVTSEDEVRVSVASSKNDSLVGGIIGYAGNLSANYTYAGGKYFEVSGFQYAGGFAGSVQYGKIDYSAASGYILASGNDAAAGGFVGYAGNVTISNSYAGGHTKDGQYLDDETGEGRYNVQSSGKAGGFAGTTNGGTISDCYSTASVFGASDTGGFRGTGSGKITNSYCTGLVKASGQIQAGAFVGNNWEYYTNEEINGNRYITRINASQNLIDVGNNVQNHVATGVAYSDLVQENKSGASPFDELLSKEEGYPFPAVNIINDVAHYGDWPLLQPPKSLDVAVMNDEILYADVVPEGSSTSLPENLTVVIKGQSSNHYQQFVIAFNQDRTKITSILRTGWANGQQSGDSQDSGSEDLSSFAHITDGKLRLYLDDVTTEGGTFAKLCPALWPGEAIKVVAYEGAQTMDAESLSSYAVSFDKAVAHNSLFADSTQAAASRTVDNIQAHISMNRHLQNLDESTSKINDDANLKVTGAVLDNDLDWLTFARKVAEIKGTNVPKVNYTGIVNNDLTDFGGNSHTISSLTIDNSKQTVEDTDNGAGYSGLFREIKTDSEIKIHNLTLKNMVSTGIVAGGLVGMHSDGTLTIDNVGVLYDDNSSAAITASGGNGNAGGLVGMSRSSLSITDSVVAGKNMTVTSDDSASAGGLVGAHSAGTLTISNSAAAVYVQGGIAAGGVIGSADSAQGSKITNTYAGGHTVNGFYANSQGGEGRFNVRATAQTGNAGGLIGAAENGYISVENTYSTASVSGSTAGGLIGTAGKSVAVQKSYATGLIDSSAQTAGAFIGINNHQYSADSSDKSFGNVYLRGVNLVTLGATGNGSQDPDDDPANSTVAQPASYSEMAKEAGSGTARPYDTKLRMNYAFRQAAVIRNIVHYGDWPTVDRMNTQYLVTFHYKEWNGNENAVEQTIPRIAFADSTTNVASVVTPDLKLEAQDVFVGWFTSYDSSAEKVEDYEFQNITSDLTVYAHVETAVKFIQKDPTDPDSKDKTVTITSSFEKGTESATLTLPRHGSFLSSGYKFDGWYLGKERLGTTGEHIQVTGELKTTLKNANYTVTARYTKLKIYEVRVRFITKNEKQSDQEAIKKADGKGWTDDWVYAAPYGIPITEENLLLPNKLNQYQATAVCKDNGTRLFPESEPETGGITASLSDNNTKLTFNVEGPKADEEESADNNVTIYVIYQANTAKYTVQHIFEDTKEDEINNFDPTMANVSDLKKNLTYSKGQEYTLEQEYPADTVGQMTKAQALTGDQLPEGFHQEGWIEQKPIAADGTTTIQIRYLRNTYTLSYDLNGGKSLSEDATGKTMKQGYRTSEVYQYGENVKLPNGEKITRSGYELGSSNKDLWAVISKEVYSARRPGSGTSSASETLSIIQEGDTLVGTSFTMPAHDAYAIANWKENKYADVSVEIWRQKTTDAINAEKKTYDYEKTVKISATELKERNLRVGTILNYDQLRQLSQEIPVGGAKEYKHFTYDSEAIVSPKVKADGSTVIKLYYNRNVITIQFWQFVRVNPVTVYPFTVKNKGNRWNPKYEYSYSEPVEIYPVRLRDDWYTDWESGNKWYGHFVKNDYYYYNTYYVPAEMHNSYSEAFLNEQYKSSNFINTDYFSNLMVQYSATTADSWHKTNQGDYVFGSYHAYAVWQGLYQSNFADYKDQNGKYVWPSQYQWKYRKTNTTLTFLTKFEAPDEDSYSSSDLIQLYASDTIDKGSTIKNYLEKPNSCRGQVVDENVKDEKKLGVGDFEDSNVVKLSEKEGTYTVSNKYLGYSAYYAIAGDYNDKTSGFPIKAGVDVEYYLDLKLYYIRNSYKITFNNVGSVSAGNLENVHPDYQTVTSESGIYSISYLYKDEIKWLPLEVTPPSNDPEIDDDYVFLGWYDSADEKAHQIIDGQGKFTDDGKQYLGDNGTMPAHNIQLFAHWAAPERTVIVNLDPKNTVDSVSSLQGVKVTYHNKTYTAGPNGSFTITIRKGDTLAGLTVNENTVIDSRKFKEWRILLGGQSVRLDDTLGIYDDNTEVDALWDQDDTVTYQMIAIDPTKPDGKNKIASWTSNFIPRGTEVALDTAELQKQIPSGYVLQDGGDKAGEKKKIDQDGMVFRFYYKEPVGGWSYQVRQVIVYKDMSDQNKTIEICHKILTRTTTDQQIVVNASDLFQRDSDAYDLNYMYAVSDEGDQTSKTQVTLTKPEKDGVLQTVTFKYTPDQELLDKMVSFTDQTIEYDGNSHKAAYTFNRDLLYVTAADDADGVGNGSKKAELSCSVTYSYTENKTGTTVPVEKEEDIKTPETYTAAVEVKMTMGDKTITLLNKKRACLTIRPRVITISSNDYTYQYDGVNYQIPSGQEGDKGYSQPVGFVGNDGLKLKVTFENAGKPKQIGTIDNVISVSGLENPDCYKVILKYGKLTTTWPLTVKHVLLYGPDTDANGNPVEQKQILLNTTEMSKNTDKTVTVSPLNLTKPDSNNANDTETHWYGLEVSKKSSENNNSWQVSYNSENNDYSPKSADGKTVVNYSRYNAKNHTYTVYYELPMLQGITAVDDDGNWTFQDPGQSEYAQAYESGNEKLYVGAKILVDALNKAVSEKERQDQKIMTRTTYSYRLESSPDRKKLSLNLIETVTKYMDKNNDGVLDEDEIKDENRVSSTETTPNPVVTTTELRSVTIDTQQTSSGGQEAPASSTP